jgi:two-component system sensor histidine kinase PilS (NtrC family)
MFEPRRILRWIYIGRLSLAAAIFLAAVFAWQHADARDTLAASLVLVGTISFTVLSAWYQLSRRGERLGQTFRYAQPLFDVALVTVVVHITGGASSQFAALYILVTVAASLLLPAAATLLIATLGNALYFGDCILGHDAQLDFFLVLQLSIFAIVALGTAYLSARLQKAEGDREELETQLALAKLQAADILRNIRSGIMTIDARGRLLYSNPAAGTMLGIDVPSMLGQPIMAVLGTAAPELAAALDRAVRLRERVSRYEGQITVDGHSFPIGLATTIIDADGTPDGVSATVIFQDISSNKRLEELRLRAERLEAVAELSASLAHEIKNPLASIRSAVEQLALVPAATSDERTLGTLIVREADRLSRLLSEFLDFARVRATRGDRVDVGEVARAATHLAAAHPDCKQGVRVNCVVPHTPLLVEGDEDLLHRAVFNLALNAMQAATERGWVNVEVSAIPAGQIPSGVTFQGGAVALRITDNGPGIPTDIRDRVFDPFFTTKVGGTGLGLPVVHRAIEAHHGFVFVDSTAAGTRFTVLLPCLQPALAGAA